MNGSKKITELIKTDIYLEKPIFIVGSGRSGTTLMHSLLDNHPQLLVFPFEYPYYSFFNRFIKKTGIKSHNVNKLNKFFYSLDQKDFGQTTKPGVGKEYSLTSVDSKRFFSILDECSQEVPTRKQYLQLLIYAYHQAYTPNHKPNSFVLKINIPTSEVFDDFPNAKLVYMMRNPITTYISIKKFYFRAYKSNPSAAYHSRGANRAYKWGLIETAATPILYSHNWLRRHQDHPGLFEVKLEELQKNPNNTMKKNADFLNISFQPSLLEATMLGESYGSNLSSGKDSGGKIVRQNLHESERYRNEMTIFERWWTERLFNKITHEGGYAERIPALKLSMARRIKEFWVPMKNEFPFNQIEIDKIPLLIRIIRVIYRWARSLINYLMNRIFFLKYSEEKVIFPG